MSGRLGWRQANATIGGGIFLLLLLCVTIGFFWLPFDPVAVDLRARLAAPSAVHWLGTDEFGRDVFSRLVRGAQTSTGIAAVTVALAVALGSFIGMVAGFFGGWLDRLLMMMTDALLAFPGILLALALMVVLGGSRSGLILALTLAYAPAVTRLVRGTVLSLREREFIENSRIIGNGAGYTLMRHILPNTLAPVAVLATTMFGWVLLSESALSFLGLGVAPPAPTWGNMLAASRPYLDRAPWLSLAPGFAIALTLGAINLLGDALRDRLDPRMAPSSV